MSRQRVGTALFVVVAGYFLLLYSLPAIRYYQTFQLQNFDYGILYHSTWRLSAGLDSFMTVRGVHAWADNQEYLQWLLVPFHWLPGTPFALLGVHALALWACGMAVFLLLRGHQAAGLLAGLFVWTSPFLRNMSLDLMHVEAFAGLFLLLLYAACRAGRSVAALVFAALALACKEDVAISVIALLAVVAVDTRSFALPRRVAVAGIAIAVSVLAVNLFVVLPHFADATCERLDPSIDALAAAAEPVSPFFHDLRSKLASPAFYAERLGRPEALLYLASLLWPVMIVLRRAPLLALLPLPAALINTLAEGGYFVEGYWHYDHSSFAMVAIAAVHGVYSAPRPLAWASVLLAGNLVWGAVAQPVPRVGLTDPLQAKFWDLAAEESVQGARALARVLPQDVVTTVDYTTLNYMIDGRPDLYMFPNPFKTEYFGIEGRCSLMADPPAVDLVVLNPEYPVDPALLLYLERDYEEWSVSRRERGFRFRVFVRPEGPRAEDVRSALRTFPGVSRRLPTRGER